MSPQSTSSIVLVDGVRTPVGRYGGALQSVRPDDLMALTLKAIVERNPSLPVDQIEDVLVGCANQAGEDNRNVARMAVLLAGYPEAIGGGTVNRLCGSGLMAINQAAHAMTFGDGDIMLAGGVESMTRAPYAMEKPAHAFDRSPTIYDTTIGWRFTNPKLAKLHHPYSMGETAENVAQRYKVSREAQDEFAYGSQQKAGKALQDEVFADEIVPVTIPQRKGDPVVVSVDEHPRPETTLEKLAKLKPAFQEGGTVTAGNASGINDGAAVILMMTEVKAQALNMTPIARIRSTAVAGVDPACMGLGPIPATQKALRRAGITVDDLDWVELNEAFAAQAIPCMDELNLDPAKVNPYGGAIALGHPLGCTGARMMTTLLHAMKRTPSLRYGLVSMCIGVGQGIAAVVERV